MDVENELKHWGILGMKWGVRRYQNPDGSLTPEGRERYSKKMADSIASENKTYKLASKAVNTFNAQLPRINSVFDPNKDYTAEETDKVYEKEWKKIYSDLLKKEYGEIADKLYDDEKEWLDQFEYYHLFEHKDDELKHWGILGMKWGIRRFQNDDGSLTPAGRLRYGVGAGNSKNLKGLNDAGSLSDEELRNMTKRYRNQANYYQARNEYIQQEQYFKQMTAPKKKEHRFLNNVFVRPLESFLSKNAEFAYGALGYAVLGGEDSEFATQYFNAITNSHLQTKEKKDPEKEKYKKEYEQLEREYDLAKKKNDIEAEKWKQEHGEYFYNGNQKSLINQPNNNQNKPNQSNSNNGKPSKGKNFDEKITPFDSADYFEPLRQREAELFQTKFSDLLKDTSKVPTDAELQLLQNELDAHLTTPTYKYGEKRY